MYSSAKLLAIGLLIIACGCGNGNVSSVGDFTVQSLFSSVTIQPGGAAVDNFSINAINGFNGRIILSLSDIPEGVAFAPSPSLVTGPGTYTMSMAVATDVGPGTYTIPFHFTSGQLQHSYNVVLQVQ